MMTNFYPSPQLPKLLQLTKDPEKGTSMTTLQALVIRIQILICGSADTSSDKSALRQHTIW